MVGISPEEARAFCEWLSTREKFTVRLPSDAEWGAAVGSWKIPVGSSVAPRRERVTTGARRPPVICPAKDGGWPTSMMTAMRGRRWWGASWCRLGFFDLGGNAAEWCQDEYRRTMNTAEARKAIPVLEKEKSDDGTPYRVVRRFMGQS